MRNQLAAYSIVFAFVLVLGLISLSGTVLLVAIPVLLYILASDLFREKTHVIVKRRLSAGRVTPDAPVTVTLSITNDGTAIREARVSDTVPDGLVVEEGNPSCHITMQKESEFSFSYVVRGNRGSYEFDRVQVETSGDFPLRREVTVHSLPQELVTLPEHRALSRVPIAPRRTLVYAGTLPARRGGEGTEFYDVRMHSGRGEARHVNWRLSARLPGQLYVNEFQEERVADVGIILDARERVYPGWNRKLLFESAAVASASMADVLLDQGNRVGFLAYGVSLDWTNPGFGRAQKQRILTRIARITPGTSMVFHRLDHIPERLLPGGSQIMLVSPLSADDAHAIMRLASLGYSVLVVSPNPVSGHPSENKYSRAARRVLLHRLRHAGIPVVDWNSNEPFDTAVNATLGEIQAMWRHRRR